MTRWKFRNRLKSSQGLRLRVLITRAAAFGHPLVLVLSARSGSSPALDSGRIQKPPDSQFGLLGHKVHSYAAFSRAAIRRVPAIYP